MVVVVGVTTVWKALPRVSSRGRLLISRNFGDSNEIVPVVSLDIDCGEFINGKYCSAFRSRSLITRCLIK